MAKFIRNNKFYLLGFLVLAIVLIVNAFPKGYVFSGGDTSQFIEAKNNLRSLFYEWQGRAFFYYAIFYVLDYLKVSDTAQLSGYLGIFIVGSYISFGIFSALIFKASDKARTLVSLFYALNLYSLSFFSGNLGFSYYPSLYIFIPILSGLFIKFLISKKNICGVFFILMLAAATAGFGNPAFAFSSGIFLLLIIFCLAFLRIIKINRSLLIRIFILGAFSFLISAYWILPLIPQMKSGMENLKNSQVLEFNYVIRDTASPILNTISLLYPGDDSFPNNFPYAGIYSLKKVFIALAFLPVMLVFLGLFYLKKYRKAYQRYYLAVIEVFLIMVMFAARVTDPFKIINHYVYGIWGMEMLRGFDKTAIFLPFLLAFLLLILFSQFGEKKWLTAVMVIVILTPLPYYFGKIQQNLSYRFSGASPQNKDYQKSRLSFLVKIPDKYYQIRNEINSDSEKSLIATLPYSTNDGSGISNFPKWKMYGTDITKFLYNKTLLPANESYFTDWNFAQAFNDENNPDNQWLIKLLGAMDVKYIIYHKDSPDDAVLNSQEKIKRLESDGFIKKLDDNSYFTLYEIKKDYIIPYVSLQNENMPITSDLARIDKVLDNIRNNYQTMQFTEINPKKFKIIWNNGNINRLLVLAEPYDSNWKAYLVSKNGEEKEITSHILARGYANGWQINEQDIKNNQPDHILVEYYPIRLMMRGLFISLMTALFLLAYLVVYYYGKRRTIGKNNP